MQFALTSLSLSTKRRRLQGSAYISKLTVRTNVSGRSQSLLTPGFIGTVIFFHQVHVAEVKGWALADMAAGYPIYAAVSILSALAAGWAADRFGPARLLPVLLVPMGVSMLLLGGVTSVWGWVALLGLLAVTQGIQNAFWGAFLPWVYGTDHLGSVRALTVAIMVVSTAIGPGLTGLAIDLGVSFPEQGIALGLWCLVLAPASLLILRRLKAETDGRLGPALT